MVDTLPDTLQVRERGYVSAAQAVRITAGRAEARNFRLVPAPPPCCSLDGVWDAVFLMDSAPELGPRPTARTVSGSIVFADSIPSAWPARPPSRNVRQQAGRSQLDFTLFFGGPIATDVSTSVVGETGPSFLREVDAAVFSGDSVVIDLIPRITHGAVSLHGVIHGDSIQGRWHLRGNANYASGHARLRHR